MTPLRDKAIPPSSEARVSPSFEEAAQAFQASLVGKSPSTQATYGSALRRLAEFLERWVQSPRRLRTSDLPGDLLERFYTWLVRVYGRERRSTLVTYVAGARAFMRFLFRQRIGPPGHTYEEMRTRLQEAMGRVPYRTPRVDRRLPLLVTYVNSLPIPEGPGRIGAKRLELLRDKALVNVLFCTGMRREEVSRVNRADLDDGRATQALITGKGDRERVVFFDEATLARVRAYLAARGDDFEPLFLRHDKGRARPGRRGAHYRLSPQSVWRVVKRYARLAGVNASTHAFRHAKASVLLNRGAKLSEVQDILGHASPETTKRIYAHYEVAHLREAFDRFSASAEELAAELPPDPPTLDP